MNRNGVFIVKKQFFLLLLWTDQCNGQDLTTLFNTNSTTRNLYIFVGINMDTVYCHVCSCVIYYVQSIVAQKYEFERFVNCHNGQDHEQGSNGLSVRLKENYIMPVRYVIVWFCWRKLCMTLNFALNNRIGVFGNFSTGFLEIMEGEANANEQLFWNNNWMKGLF